MHHPRAKDLDGGRLHQQPHAVLKARSDSASLDAGFLRPELLRKGLWSLYLPQDWS